MVFVRLHIARELRAEIVYELHKVVIAIPHLPGKPLVPARNGHHFHVFALLLVVPNALPLVFYVLPFFPVFRHALFALYISATAAHIAVAPPLRVCRIRRERIAVLRHVYVDRLVYRVILVVALAPVHPRKSVFRGSFVWPLRLANVEILFHFGRNGHELRPAHHVGAFVVCRCAYNKRLIEGREPNGVVFAARVEIVVYLIHELARLGVCVKRHFGHVPTLFGEL